MADGLRVPLYEAEREMKPCTVAVTGGTGYVAGPLIERLLLSGHTVHATCRNPENRASIAHLMEIPGAEKRLKFFKADLLVDGSFVDAFQGCKYVFHTASPILMYCPSGKEYEILIRPAVEGTKNVVNAVNKAKSVEKLIQTSSVAALYGDPHEKGKDHIYTEDDWNNLASDKVLPYFYSKTLAEKTATKMCKLQSRWKLAVLNPGMIFGPPLNKRADGESVQLMKSMVGGLMWLGAPDMGIGVVDVRDVAAGHCMVMARKEACGRHILVSGSYDFFQMTNMLRPLYPSAYLANHRIWSFAMRLLGPFVGYPSDFITYLYGKTPHFDTSKAKKLGLSFVHHLETMEDMIQSMARNGILSKSFLKDSEPH